MHKKIKIKKNKKVKKAKKEKKEKENQKNQKNQKTKNQKQMSYIDNYDSPVEYNMIFVGAGSGSGSGSDYDYDYDYDCNSDSGSGSDSDVNSREIDYPDSSDVMWSDDEEAEFHYKDMSQNSPVIRNRRLQMLISKYHGSMMSEELCSMRSSNCNVPSYSSPNSGAVLPKTMVEKRDCAICLDECRENTLNMYCSTQCGNVFHSKCINKYIHEQTKTCNERYFIKCPLCRVPSRFLIVNRDRKEYPINK